jgi:O-antigen ligase
MSLTERLRTVVWTALLLQIPFELKDTLLGLSNLQWTFIFLVLINLPSLYQHRKSLIADRLVQAAGVFVVLQWLAATYAPEFNNNAYKAAIRFSAGALLLVMARISPERTSMLRTWTYASMTAAIYALISEAGLGIPGLFRDSEFFVAQVQRLSGSFEYPNVAAAYFAISLPLVWWSPVRPALRWTAAILLWIALVLTFSRGAAAALLTVIMVEMTWLWTRRQNWRLPAGLIAAGAIAAALTIPLSPYMVDVLKRTAAANPPDAEYTTSWNRLRQQPNIHDEVPVRVKNVGTIPWLAKGTGRVALGYKWRNRDTGRFDRGAIVTLLPHDVQPGETADLAAQFQTPAEPGRYSLILDLFVRNFDWFSNAGVFPAVIVSEIQPGVSRGVDIAQIPPRHISQLSGAQFVSRSELWRAALKMFREHPFGVGPDNYRLLYGRFLGFPNWNTNIYSNNLYLEVLTGSGILGLIAFGLIIVAAAPSKPTACALGAAVFLVHGFLDVFLMATPIYFSFWTMLGVRNVGTGFQPARHVPAKNRRLQQVQP